MYTVDAEKITIRDLKVMDRPGIKVDELLEVLRKCVTVDDGRDIEDLPATHLFKIADALKRNLRESGAKVGN